MLTKPDFEKKQIIFVFAKEGEKIGMQNSNLVVCDKDGKVKFQCTFYRLFVVFIIGHTSITTPIIAEAYKYGFFFILMTSGFRTYSIIGASKDGNTLLKEKQYSYSGLDLARHLARNKIAVQYQNLFEQRYKNVYVKEAENKLKEYYAQVANTDNLNSIMAFEGLASKIYFKNHFNNLQWNGRQPRIKKDRINSILDISYTLLFSFIDAMLSIYGFDIYKGVFHQQFYMRKSLVCDVVEPFRPVIDKTIKKAYNLKQIDEDDFLVINHRYNLKWEKSPEYVSIFMQPILEIKNQIFEYIQRYYRCFMKSTAICEYPFYYNSEVISDPGKL